MNPLLVRFWVPLLLAALIPYHCPRAGAWRSGGPRLDGQTVLGRGTCLTGLRRLYPPRSLPTNHCFEREFTLEGQGETETDPQNSELYLWVDAETLHSNSGIGAHLHPSADVVEFVDRPAYLRLGASLRC